MDACSPRLQCNSLFDSEHAKSDPRSGWSLRVHLSPKPRSFVIGYPLETLVSSVFRSRTCKITSSTSLRKAENENGLAKLLRMSVNACSSRLQRNFFSVPSVGS